MTQREQQTVLDILGDNTRHDYSEAKGDRGDLARQAVDNASEESLACLHKDP